MNQVHPSVVRALEDLLRRVLRAPHGVDTPQVWSQTRAAVAVRRERRRLSMAVAGSSAAALVLLGWVASRWPGS